MAARTRYLAESVNVARNYKPAWLDHNLVALAR